MPELNTVPYTPADWRVIALLFSAVSAMISVVVVFLKLEGLVEKKLTKFLSSEDGTGTLLKILANRFDTKSWVESKAGRDTLSLLTREYIHAEEHTAWLDARIMHKTNNVVQPIVGRLDLVSKLQEQQHSDLKALLQKIDSKLDVWYERLHTLEVDLAGQHKRNDHNDRDT